MCSTTVILSSLLNHLLRGCKYLLSTFNILSLIFKVCSSHDLVLIDIVTYLIAQYFLIGDGVKYIPSEYIDNTKPINIDYAINQDSFPEIPHDALDNIVKFLILSGVKEIFSYNHSGAYHNQTDWRKVIVDNGFLSQIAFDSPLRPGYKIEIFNLPD